MNILYVYVLTDYKDEVCGVYTTQNAAYEDACAQEGEPLESIGTDVLLECGVMRGFNLRVLYHIDRFTLKGA